MNKITIVMRSHNDAQFARRTLCAIKSQSMQNFKIVCFDNASADSTKDILREFGVETVDVPEGAYVPGKVLNEAVKKYPSDITVFNNLDCVPLGREWLKNLLEPILSGVADMAYARQIARKDAFMWVERDYLRAFPEEPRGREGFFSMASSAVGAEVFRRLKFDESLRYSEDAMLAKSARELGFKIAYASRARVEHSHNYSSAEISKRFAGEGAADQKIFGGNFGIFRAALRAVSDIIKDLAFAAKNKKLSQFPAAARARCIQKKSYYLGRKATK